MKCKKHHYKIGLYIKQTLVGIPDFADGVVCTVSPGGTGKLSKCFKCKNCGHSILC